MFGQIKLHLQNYYKYNLQVYWVYSTIEPNQYICEAMLHFHRYISLMYMVTDTRQYENISKKYSWGCFIIIKFTMKFTLSVV